MLQDLRHGVRMLLQSKGWTTVVVLSLALGIGANTALFSGVNGLLLRAIPVRQPETLVRLAWSGKNDMGNDFNGYGSRAKTPDGQDVGSSFPYPMYQQFLKDNQTMSDMIAGAPKGQLNVVVDGHAEIARGFVASGNFYQVLGVSAVLGRTIVQEDDRPSASPVAVISEGYWKRRFGGNRDILGKVVQVNNTPVTVVGVTPADFTGIQQSTGSAPDITLPLWVDPKLDSNVSQELTSVTAWWLQIMGRLKPGVTAAQVQGNLNGVFQETARTAWSAYVRTLTDQERSSSHIRNRLDVPRLLVDSGRRGVYDPPAEAFRGMTILAVVVVVLLLIVCANVANLLLSRAESRQKEISVRLSIGATRTRLIRQLLTESVLLAFIGGVAGLAVGYWGRQLLPQNVGNVPFDWRLFLFVSALTLTVGIIFGIAPALRATGMNVSSTLKENSRSISGSRTILSRALLVLQVAMSLALLVGAGLFLTTLRNLRQVDIGFDPKNILMFRVNPQLNRYDQNRIATLYANMFDGLQAVPGVQSVSLSQPALLSGSVSSTSIYISGHIYTGQYGDSVNQVTVSASFFKTLGISLLSGRLFNDHDDSKFQRVAIINETAARKYFGSENPIGKTFGNELEKSGQTEIVGVIRDTKYNSLREAAPPTVYFEYRQRCADRGCPGVTFEVRTANDVSGMGNSLREAVRRIDANLPLLNVTTQAEQIEGRLLQEKLFAQSYALFGGLALLLASIGLFGLMSYNVARRTNEIGVRMALGAQRRDVLGLVMKESMILVGAGIALGLAATIASGTLIANLLFGLTPTDAVTLLSVMALMIVVSSIAGYLPARRAARLDPMVALHYE